MHSKLNQNKSILMKFGIEKSNALNIKTNALKCTQKKSNALKVKNKCTQMHSKKIKCTQNESNALKLKNKCTQSDSSIDTRLINIDEILYQY